MNAKWRVRIAAGLLSVLSSGVMAEQLSTLDLPNRTESRWVTRGSNHNGHLIQIMRFNSDLSVEEMAEFYRTKWQSDSDTPGFMESDNDGWHIIGRLTTDYQWVVQIKPSLSGSGSEGIISLFAMHRIMTRGVKNAKFMPLPRGADLVSTTHSEQPALAQTQTVLFNGRPIRVADVYKRHAHDHGWALQDEYSHHTAVTLRFERGGRQLDVALADGPHGRTVIFINEVVHETR